MTNEEEYGEEHGEELEFISSYVREVPNYPVEGVSYKDITPLIENGPVMRSTVNLLSESVDHVRYSKVLCAEARGFVFGTALAYKESKGVVLARKPNKLPRDTISANYELEYGTDSLEIHADSIRAGERVLVVDDLLATGGTANAMCELVESAGGEVSTVAFIIELSYLRGRDSLSGYNVSSLLPYYS